MDGQWIDILVVGLVVVFIASRFFKFKLPKDPMMGAKKWSRSKGKPMFGRLHLDDLKMPELQPTKETEEKKGQERRVVQWDPERLRLGKGLEGAAMLVAIDPGFDEKAFVRIMEGMFTRFVEIWNRKDVAALEIICSPTLVGKMMREWGSKAWKPLELAKVEDISILTTRTAGRTAIVEVLFRADVRKGNSAQGGMRKLEQRWVVARPFHSEDPSWEIQSITTGAKKA